MTKMLFFKDVKQYIKKKLKERARMFLAKKKPLFVHENRRFRLR